MKTNLKYQTHGYWILAVLRQLPYLFKEDFSEIIRFTPYTDSNALDKARRELVKLGYVVRVKLKVDHSSEQYAHVLSDSGKNLLEKMRDNPDFIPYQYPIAEVYNDPENRVALKRQGIDSSLMVTSPKHNKMLTMVWLDLLKRNNGQDEFLLYAGDLLDRNKKDSPRVSFGTPDLIGYRSIIEIEASRADYDRVQRKITLHYNKHVGDPYLSCSAPTFIVNSKNEIGKVIRASADDLLTATKQLECWWRTNIRMWIFESQEDLKSWVGHAVKAVHENLRQPKHIGAKYGVREPQFNFAAFYNTRLAIISEDHCYKFSGSPSSDFSIELDSHPLAKNWRDLASKLCSKKEVDRLEAEYLNHGKQLEQNFQNRLENNRLEQLAQEKQARDSFIQKSMNDAGSFLFDSLFYLQIQNVEAESTVPEIELPYYCPTKYEVKDAYLDVIVNVFENTYRSSLEIWNKQYSNDCNNIKDMLLGQFRRYTYILDQIESGNDTMTSARKRRDDLLVSVKDIYVKRQTLIDLRNTDKISESIFYREVFVEDPFQLYSEKDLTLLQNENMLRTPSLVMIEYFRLWSQGNRSPLQIPSTTSEMSPRLFARLVQSRENISTVFDSVFAKFSLTFLIAGIISWYFTIGHESTWSSGPSFDFFNWATYASATIFLVMGIFSHSSLLASEFSSKERSFWKKSTWFMFPLLFLTAYGIPNYPQTLIALNVLLSSMLFASNVRQNLKYLFCILIGIQIPFLTISIGNFSPINPVLFLGIAMLFAFAPRRHMNWSFGSHLLYQALMLPFVMMMLISFSENTSNPQASTVENPSQHSEQPVHKSKAKHH